MSSRGQSQYLLLPAVDAFFQNRKLVPKSAHEKCPICFVEDLNDDESPDSQLVVMGCCGQMLHKTCKLQHESYSKVSRCIFCVALVDEDILRFQQDLSDLHGVPDIYHTPQSRRIADAVAQQAEVRRHLEARDEAARAASFKRLQGARNQVGWENERKARDG